MAPEKKKKGFISFMREFLKQFSESSASMISNGMVYSTLIAVIPCLAVVYAVLSFFGVLDPVVAVLEENILTTFGEGTGETLLGYLRTFTENAVGMGIVSLLSFGLTFVLLIDKIFGVINRIYHAPNAKNLVTKYLKYVGIIILGLLGIVLAVFLIGRFNSLSVKFRHLAPLNFVQNLIKELAPVAALFGLLLAMICLIPNCRVNFKSALIGTIFGTVGVTGLGYIFKFVVSRSVKYSVIYGSLATLMFFFMFLSYLWKIVFSSVIISYVHQNMTTGFTK